MVVLSGCSSKNKPLAVESDADAADQGSIRGHLLTEEAIPLADAEVALQSDMNHTKRTGADGGFEFHQLKAGPYVVIAQAFGYAAVGRAIEVRAGETTPVELLLKAQPVPGLAYRVPLQPLHGRYFCGFAVSLLTAGACKVVGGGPGVIDATWASATGGDHAIWDFPNATASNRTVPGDQLSAIVAELIWVPATASANTLSLSVENSGGHAVTQANPAGIPKVYGSATGGPGLKVVVTVDKASPGNADGEILSANETGFGIAVWPDAGSAPASTLLSQEFQVWLTLFYNELPPPDYTVLG